MMLLHLKYPNTWSFCWQIEKKFGFMASFPEGLHIPLIVNSKLISHLKNYHLNSTHLFRVLGWVFWAGCCEWSRGYMLGWISQMFSCQVTMRSQCYRFWCWLACCIFREIQYQNWFRLNNRVCRLDHLN